MTSSQRDAMARAIRAQSDRLAADLERMTPRAKIRCHEGCLMLTTYSHPQLGRVIVRPKVKRAERHARWMAQDDQDAPVLAAPVEALIAAAGGLPVGSLLACRDHLEASVSPDALRWLAQRRGTVKIDPEALPHKGIAIIGYRMG